MDPIMLVLHTHLKTTPLPIPSATWLSTFLTTTRHPLGAPPTPALLSHLRTRLLNSDLTATSFLDASHNYPFPLHTSFRAENLEQKIPKDVFVQIVDIEDLTRSRWEQVDELEGIERGEQTKGREIIRVIEEEGNEETTQGTQAVGTAGGSGGGGSGEGSMKKKKNSMHRIVVQDFKGFKAYALEMERIEGLGIGINGTKIGAKMLIRGGTLICRGTILLQQSNCVYIGGGITSWHKKWLEERKAALKKAGNIIGTPL